MKFLKKLIPLLGLLTVGCNQEYAKQSIRLPPQHVTSESTEPNYLLDDIIVQDNTYSIADVELSQKEYDLITAARDHLQSEEFRRGIVDLIEKDLLSVGEIGGDIYPGFVIVERENPIVRYAEKIDELEWGVAESAHIVSDLFNGSCFLNTDEVNEIKEELEEIISTGQVPYPETPGITRKIRSHLDGYYLVKDPITGERTSADKEDVNLVGGFHIHPCTKEGERPSEIDIAYATNHDLPEFMFANDCDQFHAFCTVKGLVIELGTYKIPEEKAKDLCWLTFMMAAERDGAGFDRKTEIGKYFRKAREYNSSREIEERKSLLDEKGTVAFYEGVKKTNLFYFYCKELFTEWYPCKNL